MLIFTKILAFILLLLWGALTIVITLSIIGAIVFEGAEQWNNWFCGGRRMLEKILQ